MIQSLVGSNNTIIQIYTESMQKPDSKLLKSITPKPSGLWSRKFNKVVLWSYLQLLYSPHLHKTSLSSWKRLHHKKYTCSQTSEGSMLVFSLVSPNRDFIPISFKGSNKHPYSSTTFHKVSVIKVASHGLGICLFVINFHRMTYIYYF